MDMRSMIAQEVANVLNTSRAEQQQFIEQLWQQLLGFSLQMEGKFNGQQKFQREMRTPLDSLCRGFEEAKQNQMWEGPNDVH